MSERKNVIRTWANDPRGNSWAATGFIFFATLIAYLPSMGGAFIWNDSDYVTRPELRSLTGLGRIWTELGATEQYYPLLHSAFWVQCHLFGDNPLGYHVVAVLLHASAATLFGRLLRRLAVPGAWLAAILFALHPVHVESVAWITEQKNTLSLVFFLAAAFVYLRYDETRRPVEYIWAFGLFAVSLLLKTVTVTLPAALLVVFWWKRGRLEWRRDWRPLLPWLLAGVATGLFSSWVERRYLGAEGMEFELSLLQRLLVAGRAVWFYLGKLAWPAALNFIYPRWTPDVTIWWQWVFPVGLIALAVVLWRIRGYSRAPLATLLLFVGSLFPVLGFVNLYGMVYSFVWDHWQYLPDLAPFALIAACFVTLWNRLAAGLRLAGFIMLTLLVGLYGLVTWRHCGLFSDNETLYRQTLARNPGCWMAHSNLASMLRNRPETIGEALGHIDAALSLRPDLAEAHTNRGAILADIPGRLSEALAECETAVRLNPNLALARCNYGVVLTKLPGRDADAIAAYQDALRLKPGYAEAYLGLGTVLMGMSPGSLEAIAAYETALKINPTMAEAHHGLALALANIPERLPEAVIHLERAVQIKPDYVEAHNDLGMLLLDSPGRLVEACEHFRAALRLQRDYPEAHNNLANALAREPDGLNAAIGEYEEALRLRPDFAEARFNLALVYLRMPGGKARAVAQLEEVVRLRPDLEHARGLLEQLRTRAN